MGIVCDPLIYGLPAMYSTPSPFLRRKMFVKEGCEV